MRSTVGYVFDTRTTDERTDELLENLKGEVLKAKKKEKNPEEVSKKNISVSRRSK